MHRWSGSGLPCDHGGASCRARATRRYAANDGARNIDFECFLGSSGTRPLHTVPLQCHPNQCAGKHLRPRRPGATSSLLSCCPNRPIGRALFVVFVTQLHQLGSRIGSARAASPSSTALSLSQNRASRVSRATILSHAGRLPMHRSTAIALSGTGCKQCDRPAARITIGRIGIAVHRIICGFDIAGFTSALRSITEVQRTSRHFAFVPTTDLCLFTQLPYRQSR